MQQHKYLPKYDEDFGKPFINFSGVQIGTLMQTINAKHSKPDAYDGDKATVSVYDGSENYGYQDKYKGDFTMPNDLAQKHWVIAVRKNKDTFTDN